MSLRAAIEKAMPDIAASMPWYDDAHPDYTEAINAIIAAVSAPQDFIPGFNVRFIELDNACAYLVSHGWAGGIPFDMAVKAVGNEPHVGPWGPCAPAADTRYTSRPHSPDDEPLACACSREQQAEGHAIACALYGV